MDENINLIVSSTELNLIVDCVFEVLKHHQHEISNLGNMLTFDFVRFNQKNINHYTKLLDQHFLKRDELLSLLNHINFNL